MPDLPAIFDAIRLRPDDERHWLILAGRLWDNGWDEEARRGASLLADAARQYGRRKGDRGRS